MGRPGEKVLLFFGEMMETTGGLFCCPCDFFSDGEAKFIVSKRNINRRPIKINPQVFTIFFNLYKN
jgi:hypothetical protein